jgi:GR25 family glycosyltransferase involved in LPS biosynthesis
MAGGKPMDIRNLPVYAINLTERKDRWKRFMSNEAIRTFHNLERLPGTNGKKLDYKTDKRISMGTKLRIHRNYRRSHYEIATLGAIGASISHVRTWQKFVESGEPICIVLEDDAIWTSDLIDKANELYPSLPSNWGMWILGYRLPTLVIEHLSKEPWNQVHSFTAAHSYILKRETAKKLLEEPFPVDTHIEYYMTACATLKNFLIVQHPDMFVDYYRTYIGPRTNDSNTSQHKKKGCPTCDVPDEHSQLYKHFTRKGTKGMVVSGIVYGKQSNHVLTFKNNANTVHRKKTRKSKKKD